MRRATNDTQWLKSDSGEIVGIALGFDFCAEHEFGMDYLKSAFSLPDGPIRGLESRKIHTLPNIFVFKKYKRKPSGRGKGPQPKQDCAALVCYAQGGQDEASRKALVKDALGLVDFWTEEGSKYFDPSKHNISAAWDDRSFAVTVRGSENIEALKSIYEAFKRFDIVLAPGTGVSFLRSFGLTFVIDSKIDDKTRAEVLEADLEHIRLMEAARETGVEELLSKAGKRWHALSPAWTNAQKSEVHFFLNPCDERRYQYGWYSAEDLKAWARDEGPVMIKTK